MLLIENPLNSSELVFPILECFHIVGFTFSLGTVMIVNFRLLGMGLTNQTPAQLWKDTQWWTLGGLILMVFSGLLLFSSDPDNYYLNYAFLLKMLFLILAIIYNYTKVRKTAASNPPPGAGKGVAITAMVLWACVVFGGIFIGFLTSTLDINHI
jgi:hypothetical protein